MMGEWGVDITGVVMGRGWRIRSMGGQVLDRRGVRFGSRSENSSGEKDW